MRWKSLLIIVLVFVFSGVLAGYSQVVFPDEDLGDIFEAILEDTVISMGMDPNDWEISTNNRFGKAVYDWDNSGVYLAIYDYVWGILNTDANTTFHGFPARFLEFDAGYSELMWGEDGYTFIASPNISNPYEWAEALRTQAHAHGLWGEVVEPITPPAQPTATTTDDPYDESCDGVNCDHLQSALCEETGQYSYSDPGCSDGRCLYFTVEDCGVGGCDMDTGYCKEEVTIQPTIPPVQPTPTDADPYDESCDGVSCDHMQSSLCDETSQYSYSDPGCSDGRCLYFTIEDCGVGNCNQDTGYCKEEDVCTEICPDHCEENVAYTAFDCVDGECQWITRECPFGCDVNVEGMCVAGEQTIVLQTVKEGYLSQELSVENPDANGSVTISGRVVDELSGEPLADAVITIVSGAQSAEVTTDQNGNYSLVAQGNSVDLMSTAMLNFSLEQDTNVTVVIDLQDTNMYPKGTSILDSEMEVRVIVLDSTDEVLGDRELLFEALDPNGASWGTFSGDASTNDDGFQIKMLTAGNFEIGTVVGSGLVPITVRVTDQLTGVQAEATFNVQQIKIEADYYPVLATCSDCGPYPIKVQLTHPMDEDMSGMVVAAVLDTDEGFLTDQMFGESGDTEIFVTTDQYGMAEFYFKPIMDDLTQEHIYTIYVLQEESGVVEAITIRAEPVDFAISKMQPVNFSGNTGDYAFFDVGMRENKYPTAPIDRFGLNGDSPIKFMITIRQTIPEVDLANSIAYGEQVNLVSDGEGGFRLKDSNSTPPSLHVAPTVDGINLYTVEIIVVDSVSGNQVYDANLANNNTSVLINSGTPDDWFHIFMMNGILTPHTRTGVLIKCVSSQIPYVGDAVTVVDALNEAYKGLQGSTEDVFSLSQKLVDKIAGVVAKAYEITETDLYENISKEALRNLRIFNVMKFIGDMSNCVKDFMGVEVEYAQQGYLSPENQSCCSACQLNPIYLEQSEEPYTYEDVNLVLVPFVQQLLTSLDMPDVQTIMILSSPDSSIAVNTDLDEMPEIYEDNGVYVMMLPKGESYDVQLSNATVADMILFDEEAGLESSVATHFLTNSTSFDVSFDVTDKPDFALSVDYDRDGSAEEVLMPEMELLDFEPPKIQLTAPTDVIEGYTMVRAEYTDVGGSGIQNESVRVYINGIDVTEYATIDHLGLQLPVMGLLTGQHEVRISVSDWKGNTTESSWKIQSIGRQTPLSEMLLIPSIGVCGLGGIGAIVLLVLVLRRRKKVKANPAARKDKKWFLFVLGGAVLLCAVLGTAGVIWDAVDPSDTPYPGSANLLTIDAEPVIEEQSESYEYVPPSQAEIDAYWAEFNAELELPEGVYQTVP